MKFSAESFEEIRPYNDDEINDAMHRIADEPSLESVVNYLFPDINIDDFRQELINIHAAYEFQHRIMHKTIWSIVNKTSAGLSYEGFERLKKDTAYLFISNHRDILLDSAILQIILDKFDLETSEITFGSNLMLSQFIVDFGKSNRMFTVYRNGNAKERLFNSMRLSAYIRHTITERKNSIWIAQRGGRTKDGYDKTESAILKMFHISAGGKKVVEGINELNIVPLSISYEYEPCDSLKSVELYKSQFGPYEKKDGEDLNSVITGIKQFKGRIHLAAGNPVIAERSNNMTEFQVLNKVVSDVDHQIIRNYKLWPNNYIASDLLNENSEYANHYSEKEKLAFINDMNRKIGIAGIEMEEVRNNFLGIYANPVKRINEIR